MEHDARKRKGLQPLKTGEIMYCKWSYGLLALALTACSPASDPVPKIAEDSRELLDEAKAVESQMEQAAEATRRNIDEQSE